MAKDMAEALRCISPMLPLVAFGQVTMLVLAGISRLYHPSGPKAAFDASCRWAVGAFALPFFVGGITLGAGCYTWLARTALGNSAAVFSLWLAFLPLMVAGILLGALIAHGILIFLLTWLTPDSALLTGSEAINPTLSQRVLLPAFGAVGRLARRACAVLRTPVG